MKKFLQIFTLFVAATVLAQNISDYQYISIPQKFADAKANKYGLNQLLATKLKSKKFIINENSGSNNPCGTLNAEISDISNMFTNKVKVEFKNCHNVTIALFDGRSSIKEFEPGMREALENALKGVDVSNPVERTFAESSKPIENAAVKETPKVIIQEKPQQNTEIKSETKTANKAEVYTNGVLSLNKVNISTNQFILVNPNNSVPYAIFNASSKKDVYRVQLENGIQTFGYIENGNIVLEIATSDGSFGKEIFVKK